MESHEMEFSKIKWSETNRMGKCNSETSQLMSSYKHPYIPVSGYVSLPVDLTIATYILGAWLGDGDNKDGQVYGPDQKVFDSIQKDEYELSDSHCPSRAPFQTRTVYKLVKELRNQNLHHNKHITLIYFIATVDQHLALL